MLSKKVFYKNNNITFKKIIKPQKSFSDLIDILQSYTSTIIRKANFYQVIRQRETSSQI